MSEIADGLADAFAAAKRATTKINYMLTKRRFSKSSTETSVEDLQEAISHLQRIIAPPRDDG